MSGYIVFLEIFGVLCAIAATVLAYIFILPDSKREKLPKVFQIVHDIFNFKSLLIEKILKAFYILSTLICVFVGFFMLFGFERYSYFSGGLRWTGGYGFLVMIVGPIVIRLVYEGLMMFVLLVKNTIQINNKLKNNTVKEDDDVFNDFNK